MSVDYYVLFCIACSVAYDISGLKPQAKFWAGIGVIIALLIAAMKYFR